MLTLKNIKIEDGIAEADFYPEDSQECGHIVVDTKAGQWGKIISCVHMEEYGEMYSAHAWMHLVELAKSGDNRTFSRVMWY